MKKLFLLPILLATGATVFATTNKVEPVKAVDSMTLNMSQILKDVHNDTTVNNVINDLVEYGVLAGNAEQGTFSNLVDMEGDHNDGNIQTPDGKVIADWGGARLRTTGGQYIMFGFKAIRSFTLSVSGTLGGWTDNTAVKYFLVSDTFNFDSPATPIGAAPSFTSEGLAYTIDVPTGYTFGWAWGGHSDERNLQGIANLNYSLTYNPSISTPEPEAPTAKTEILTIENVYKNTALNGGADLSSTLSTYGMRFGNAKTLSFVTPTTNGENYVVEGGLGGAWWSISTFNGVGFAFTFTAKDRITIETNLAGANGSSLGYLDGSVNVAYLVQRGSNILKTHYDSSAFQLNNLATNMDVFEYETPIELLEGETLYVQVLCSNTEGGARNLQVGAYANLSWTLTEVMISDAANTLVNNWLTLRSNNAGSLCNLNAEDTATLNSLIEQYNALDADQKTIVGRTLDTTEFTIAESVMYFTTNSSSLSYIFSNNDNSTNVLLIVGSASLIIIAGIVLLKRKNYAK